MSEVQGGCRCGAVRYKLALDALPRTYACHCRDCQTWSGRTSVQRMCAVCHTRVYNSNSARPGVVVVRAGTLDRSDELDVVAHIWVKRKQPWLKLPQEVPAWSEGAPVAELLQALAPR